MINSNATIQNPLGDVPLIDPPACDIDVERGATGRTRRILNVDQRRTRIQARRQRIAFQRSESANQTHRYQPVPWTSQSSINWHSSESFSLHDFFDRAVVVNLDRRTDRLSRFYRHLSEVGWPFRQVERFRAIDGSRVRPPAWWRAGRGAWGCHRSHLQLIEQALMDDLDTLLILEDDAFFQSDLRERAQAFLTMVPDDWQQIYLGGQHLYQRCQPPIRINEQVVIPYNVNRTHAFALHRRGMELVYRWLNDYEKHIQHPRHHVDHRLGALHATRGIKVYAPCNWIAGQFESHSNIKGKVMPTRLWNGHRMQDQTTPFVAVVGLHRSGSSCLAGVLCKLGVHMGSKLTGHEATGGFEAAGLARVCEMAYPFPVTHAKVDGNLLKRRLQKHISFVQRQAESRGTIAGGKYPHLCAMGNELESICGQGLRVVHINRPLEESIASLKTRSRNAKGWLGVSDEQCEAVQRWLWESKNEFLQRVDHLTIDYPNLLTDPACEIDRIVEYLGLEVDDPQRQAAIDHVKPELRKHTISDKSDVSADSAQTVD